MNLQGTAKPPPATQGESVSSRNRESKPPEKLGPGESWPRIEHGRNTDCAFEESGDPLDLSLPGVFSVFRVQSVFNPWLIRARIHGYSLLFSLCALSGPLPEAEAAPRYSVAAFEWKGPVLRVVPADFDGDGLLDLVRVRPGGFDVHFQRKGEGFALAEPDATLDVPGRAVGWCIASLDRGEPARIVAFVDGTEVKSWAVDPRRRAFSESIALETGLSGVLPRGFHPMPFARDVDGDGRADLVIPTAKALEVRLRGAAKNNPAERQAPLVVPAEREIRASLSGGRELTEEAGETVEIPFFTFRDVSGDGRKDVVSETDERYAVYVAGADGSYPREATCALDLGAVKKRLEPDDPESIDFSNLTEPLSRTVQVVARDVSGDGAEDLVLRAGGKVSLFVGGKGGYDFARPHQVLKSSGNVLAAAVADEDEDGKPDLWLVRIEAVSVGDIFLWLLASGTLDFDAFIYRNTAGRFADRPSRRIHAAVRFPSILSLIKQARELSGRMEERRPAPVWSGDIAGRGERRDLVAFQSGHLRVYLGKAPPAVRPRKEQDLVFAVLQSLGYTREKDEYEIDLTDVSEVIGKLESRLPRLPEGAIPDFEISLDPGSTAGAPASLGLHVLDLNGDRRDDFIAILERTEAGVRGVVALSRAE